MDNSLLTQGLLILLGVVILWVIIRFVLRLTARLFACGCGLIAIIGLAAILYLWMQG